MSPELETLVTETYRLMVQSRKTVYVKIWLDGQELSTTDRLATSYVTIRGTFSRQDLLDVRSAFQALGVRTIRGSIVHR